MGFRIICTAAIQPTKMLKWVKFDREAPSVGRQLTPRLASVPLATEAVATLGLMPRNKGALSPALVEAAQTYDHPLICLSCGGLLQNHQTQDR